MCLGRFRVQRIGGSFLPDSLFADREMDRRKPSTVPFYRVFLPDPRNNVYRLIIYNIYSIQPNETTGKKNVTFLAFKKMSFEYSFKTFDVWLSMRYILIFLFLQFCVDGTNFRYRFVPSVGGVRHAVRTYRNYN